eukprot:1135362-Prymnesium_polylepis.1
MREVGWGGGGRERVGVRAGFYDYVGCRTAGRQGMDAVRGCGGPRVCLAVTCPARNSVRVR